MRERKARVAPNGDDSLEATVPRDFELGSGEIGIVLDDQHDAVSVLDVVAIVPDVTRQEASRIELRRLESNRGRTASVPLALVRQHHGILHGVRMLDGPERGR